MSTVAAVFKGRWGYHSIDYPEFIELKKAHKLFLQAMRDCRRHDRWIAKDAHNRKGEEPIIPPINVPGWLYQSILEEYRNARYPVADQAQVKPFRLHHTIQDFHGKYEKLREFYN